MLCYNLLEIDMLLRGRFMKTVFVGMSGGVDSSVAALILKQQGYHVEGITLRLKPENLADKDIEDAQRTADALGIKLHVLDLRDYFKEKVMDYFSHEYLRGATPNPCVVCNRFIKFGAMMDYALKNGADYIATGHYAQIKRENGRTYLLHTNSKKDQSYFLCMLTQEQLSHVIFPLCSMQKDDIRAIAAQNNIPVAQKKDSQEVCFIPDNDYVSFIKKQGFADMGEGDFVNKDGEVIGRHKGVMNYTVGQRKGLGAFGKPMFVTKLDILNNRIFLGENGEQYLKSFYADTINWCSGEIPTQPFTAQVKIRFRAAPAEARVTPQGDEFLVEFNEPQRSVTPGQFAAFYSGDVVLGGAIIRTK